MGRLRVSTSTKTSRDVGRLRVSKSRRTSRDVGVTFQMVYRKVFQTFQTVKHFGQIKFLSKVLWCLNFVSRSKSEYHV